MNNDDNGEENFVPRIERAGSTGSLDRAYLRHENIEDRRGNYILTVGVPGSGKTVFQSHLLRFLMNSVEFSTDMESVDGNSTRQTLNQKEWFDLWESNSLPDRTDMDVPQEFRFSVKPLFGPKKPVSFGFIEASGEDFLRFKPQNDGTYEPNEALDRFLKNDKINFVIVLVVNGDNPNGNIDLFYSFTEYLNTNAPSMRKRTPVLALIANPVVARKKLASQSDLYRKDSTLDATAFMEEFLGPTHNQMRNWAKDYVVQQFYIGDVRLDSEIDEQRIYNTNYADAAIIFSWIYYQFTKKELKPTFFEKLQYMITGSE